MSNIIKGKGFNEIELEKNTTEHTVMLHCQDGYSDCSVELSKDKVYQKELDIIADVIDLYREQNNLVVSKYEFWLPHCLVNGNIVEHKLIAESYGISRDLALDYIIHYDNIFSELFDKSTKTYFGLPLLSSYDECLDYPLKDNTKRYLKGLKKLNNILKK